MAKIGRNAPCPCGSGKKYKKCCLPADQAREAEAAQERQRQQEAAWAAMPEGPSRPEDFFIYDEDDEIIDDYSNRVIDLIDDGDLDGAEEACKELEERFPDFIDCPDRRAMLCEARGEFEQAITYNERCLEILAEHPSYGIARRHEEAIDRLRRKIAAKMITAKLTDNES